MSKRYFCGTAGSHFTNGEFVRVPTLMEENHSTLMHFNFTVYKKEESSDWILRYYKHLSQKFDIVVFPYKNVSLVSLTSYFLYGLEVSKWIYLVDLYDLFEDIDIPSDSSKHVPIDTIKRIPSPNVKSFVANEQNQVYAISEDEFYVVENEKLKLIHLFEDDLLKKIATSFDHVVLLTETGRVYVYGMGNRGQLGLRNVINVQIPTVVEIFEGLDTQVVDICCGGWHTMCLTQSGDVYTWGWLNRGQVGHTNNEPFPLEIPHKVVSISAGSSHSFAVTEKGEFYSWGFNRFGQLGNGNADLEVVETPQQLKFEFEGKGVKVECGPRHSILHVENP